MTAFLRPVRPRPLPRRVARDGEPRAPAPEPAGANEQLRLNWQALDEASKAPYVAAAQRERRPAKLQAKIKFGDEFPWRPSGRGGRRDTTTSGAATCGPGTACLRGPRRASCGSASRPCTRA